MEKPSLITSRTKYRDFLNGERDFNGDSKGKIDYLTDDDAPTMKPISAKARQKEGGQTDRSRFRYDI